MGRPQLGLSLLLAIIASIAQAGVEMGDHPGGASIRQVMKASYQIFGKLRSIKWVAHTGRSVTMPHPGPSSPVLHITPPPGEWVEIVLLFDGPVVLRDDAGHQVVADLTELIVPLEFPVEGGRDTRIELDLQAPDGLWSAGPRLSADHPLLVALADGALAWEKSTHE